jgi:type IV pilus assembly protein PilA
MLKSTISRLRAREVQGAEEAADAGFTLIELMVVLLIIAILLAIAIPTFLGVTGSANDRAAQSNLTNALTEVKALYQNSQTYLSTSLPQATLNSSAPEFSWVQAGSTGCATQGTTCISEYPVDVTGVGSGDGVILAAYSKTGTCWYVADLESTPSTTAFTDSTPGTIQFKAATASGAAGAWQSAGLTTAAAPGAGVYYSQVAKASSCIASIPVATTSTVWNWGTTYSNAPNS